MDCKDIAVLIESRISEILDKHDYEAEVTVENYGKCVKVVGNNTFIWIRLLNLHGNVYVDINNIQFSRKYRRKGILSELCESLKSIEGIHKLVISSVCSDEMHQFCEKHNFERNEYIDGYTVFSR